MFIELPSLLADGVRATVARTSSRTRAVNARSVPEAAAVRSRFCTKPIGSRSTAMQTLLENSGRGRRHCVLGRRDSGRCRSYLHAAAKFRSWTAAFRSSAGAMRTLPKNSGRGRRHCVFGRRHSGRCRSYLHAAGKFRSWTAEFRSSAEQFGTLSRQFRTQAGPMRTLPENSGRGRRHAGCVRRHSVRCRSYLHAAGQFRTVATEFRSSAEQFRRVSREFYSRSGRTRTRLTQATFNAVACVCGQSECA
jgi:hypothetical protein